MTVTTTNIETDYSDKLGKLANLHKRSKTQELHYLIEKECDSLNIKDIEF